MKKFIPFLISALCISLIFCSCNNPQNADTDNRENGGLNYRQITQEEAKKIIDDPAADYIILDVRTAAEFNEAHIPNAICIPVETITDKEPPELPDKEQTILVYCRSGRRSKDASQKLADMGYTNILEFGGIIEWKYETVSENE